jgi:hypothetical protein
MLGSDTCGPERLNTARHEPASTFTLTHRSVRTFSTMWLKAAPKRLSSSPRTRICSSMLQLVRHGAPHRLVALALHLDLHHLLPRLEVLLKQPRRHVPREVDIGVRRHRLCPITASVADAATHGLTDAVDAALVRHDGALTACARLCLHVAGEAFVAKEVLALLLRAVHHARSERATGMPRRAQAGPCASPPPPTARDPGRPASAKYLWASTTAAEGRAAGSSRSAWESRSTSSALGGVPSCCSAAFRASMSASTAGRARASAFPRMASCTSSSSRPSCPVSRCQRRRWRAASAALLAPRSPA